MNAEIISRKMEFRKNDNKPTSTFNFKTCDEHTRKNIDITGE